MSKIMVADRPISVLHHETKSYKPNKAGEFEIDDNHVDGVRVHGLMFKEEAEAKKKGKAAASGEAALAAENAALKDEVKALSEKVAALEKAGTK